MSYTTKTLAEEFFGNPETAFSVLIVGNEGEREVMQTRLAVAGHIARYAAESPVAIMSLLASDQIDAVVCVDRGSGSPFAKCLDLIRTSDRLRCIPLIMHRPTEDLATEPHIVAAKKAYVERSSPQTLSEIEALVISNKADAERINAVLEKMGIQSIHEAQTIEDVAGILATKKISLVICDAHKPDLPYMEFLSFIRNGQLNHLPVIMHGGDKNVASLALYEGANAFLHSSCQLTDGRGGLGNGIEILSEAVCRVTNMQPEKPVIAQVINASVPRTIEVK